MRTYTKSYDEISLIILIIIKSQMSIKYNLFLQITIKMRQYNFETNNIFIP